MAEEFIPIAFFIMIGAIVIVPTWLKSKERKEMQGTLRAAIEKGQPLPPEVIDALSKDNIKPPATAARASSPSAPRARGRWWCWSNAPRPPCVHAGGTTREASRPCAQPRSCSWPA